MALDPVLNLYGVLNDFFAFRISCAHASILEWIRLHAWRPGSATGECDCYILRVFVLSSELGTYMFNRLSMTDTCNCISRAISLVSDISRSLHRMCSAAAGRPPVALRVS